jgi:hypothetical protein
VRVFATTPNTSRPAGRRRTVAARAIVAALAALAIAAVIGGVVATQLGGGTGSRTGTGAPVGGPVAFFNRTTYSNSTSATDASRFQFLELGATASRTLVDSIHAAVPHPKVVIYMAAVVQSTNNTSYGAGNCFSYRSGLPYGGVPSSYFLHDANGAVVQTGGTTYWLDPSNPNVQRGCAKAMVNQARRTHADGTTLDLVDTTLNYGGQPSCPGGSAACTTDGGYQAAMTSFLRYTARELHRNRLILVPNIGGGSVTDASGQTFWNLWTGIADGSDEESFAFGTTQRSISASQVASELQNVAWSEAHGKYTLLNGDMPQGDSRRTTYALALMLMVAGGHTSWDISEGCNTTCDAWLPVYTAAQRLGGPLGPYMLDGSVYSRRFAHGTVTANVATHTGSIP